MSNGGSVLGIDIGYSPKRRSSAAGRLTWDASDIDWVVARFRYQEPERRQTIIRTIGEHAIMAATFDGPLARGLTPIGVHRRAERMLTKRLQPLAGKPGQSSAPVGKRLNIATNEAARIVIDSGALKLSHHQCRIDQLAIAEAFPTSYLGVLLSDPEPIARGRGGKSDRFFKAAIIEEALSGLVGDLLPGRRQPDAAGITNHDERAAYICALTALGVAKRRYTAVGDNERGWIILPPWHRIQLWAQQMLEQNAAEEEMHCLVIENG